METQILPPQYKEPRSLPVLPPCRVCGDKASGFHYGANTCEGCKVFFRRSLKRQLNYKCPADKDCSILPGSRNSCQLCRFKKCLQAGMSRDAIRHGRYTHSTRTRNILEVKQLEQQQRHFHEDPTSCFDSPPASHCPQGFICSPASSIGSYSDHAASRVAPTMPDMCTPLQLEPLSPTSQQQTYLDSVVSKALGISNDQFTPYSEPPSLFISSLHPTRKHELNEFMISVEQAARVFDSVQRNSDIRPTVKQEPIENPPMPLQSWLSDGHSLIETTAADLPEFLQFSSQANNANRENLYHKLREVRPSFLGMLQSNDEVKDREENNNRSNSSVPSISELEIYLRWVEKTVRQCVKFCKMIPGFVGAISLNDQAALIKESRDEVVLITLHTVVNLSHPCSSYADSDEMLWVMHLSDIREGSTAWNIIRRMRCLNLNIVQQGLLLATVLTSSDRPELKLDEACSVDRLHATCVDALQLSLATTHPPYVAAFAKIVQIMIDLRSYGHEAKKTLPNLMKSHPFVRIPPLLQELINTTS